MKVLVLGSSGVIGRSLSIHLKNIGHEVLDWDIQIDPSHDLSNPENKENLRNIINSVDFVYFLAYDVGGSKYLSNICNDFINNNLMIMINTFDCLKNKKFIFASSQMQNMYNAYGALKQIGEHYTHSMGGISTRFWNIYGPELFSEKSHVIPDFIHNFKTNGKIELLTNGTEERQFLYTTDCAKCLTIIMDKYDEIYKERKCIDITSFEWKTIMDIARMIAPEDVISSSEYKDITQTIKNEPDTFILKYWKPEIDLKVGIDYMIHGTYN